MPVTDEYVSVTIPLPRRIFDKVSNSASVAHRTLEEHLARLVENGMASEMSVEEALDEAHQAYLRHMNLEGREPHTTDELWEQMRRIRKEVSNDLDRR